MGCVQSSQKVILESGTQHSVQVSPGRVESITFESAHAGMHANYEADNWARRDWSCSGSPHSPPHWTLGRGSSEAEKNVPVSHTRGERICLRVQLHIDHRIENVKLVGIPASSEGMCPKAKKAFTFRSETHTLEAGTCPISVTGEERLPDWPRDIKGHIQWGLKKNKTFVDLGTSGPHTVFVTFGKPKVAPEAMSMELGQGKYEVNGATHARMEEATRRIAETAEGKTPDDFVELIHQLVTNCGSFNLGILSPDQEQRVTQNAGPSAYMRRVNWPNFLPDGGAVRNQDDSAIRDQGGAWPLASLREYRGECQAIVRFVRGVLYQAGFIGSGSAEVKYVTADFEVPNQVIVRNTIPDGRCSGPRADRMYSLISGPISGPGVYTEHKLCPNKYEAYLKYRYQENGNWYQAWYGGGIGLVGNWKESGDEIPVEAKCQLIGVFNGIAEHTTPVEDPENPSNSLVEVTDYYSYK